VATPFYVAPEQMMKDRAEYARKGIARGRALVAVTWADGVLFAGENPSRTLYKTSEIYDRIGFAAVGKYNEFEALRVAGIRLADVKGYQYARQDVAAKSLANAYSQSLGAIFMGGDKPYEVELLIAEVGEDEGIDMFHIRYDGSIVDEHRYVAIGGEAETLTGALSERWQDGMTLAEALRVAHAALSSISNGDGIEASDLEVSGLDRTRSRRRFFRLGQEDVRDLLGG
jgi:proteasome alpha subunit